MITFVIVILDELFSRNPMYFREDIFDENK